MSQEPNSKPKLVIAMPRGNSTVTMGAARTFYCAHSKEMDIAVKLEGGGSASNQNFNILLGMALEMRDKGEATHWAMIHADIEAQPDWPDILYRELVAHDGHFVSANIPIKENLPQPKIRTSTAVRGLACEEELWGPRRYVMVDDRPIPVPDGFALEVYRFPDQIPAAGKSLVAIAGDRGCFDDLQIRVFDAAGRIVEDADIAADDATADPLRSLLRPLPEPIDFDADTRRAIVRAAVELADYRPAWTFGPETICADDEVLLLNIGLCMLDLNAPGIDGFAFTCLNKLVKEAETGKYRALFRSEDWEFSHHLQDAGARVLATWKVPLLHHGERAWPSYA